MQHLTSRRVFLARSATAIASTSIVYPSTSFAEIRSKNDRPQVALIGAGWQPQTKRQGRGITIGKQATAFCDVVVICELDSVAADFANRFVSDGKAELVSDYRNVIERADIDAVLIATPDHWHTKLAIEALRAGKDVYCEKPATVTIDEGKQLRAAVAHTKRVLQIGTQQRSEFGNRFLTAIAMVRDGRIGTLQRIRIGLEKGWQGGPFESSPPPPTLDFERWLGPAPLVDYITQRTHRTFRWWFEYGGGMLCDWGAHHVDIAQWAIDQADRGPISVSGTGTLNQPLVEGMPTRSDMYNTPIDFEVICKFANNIEIVIDSGRNGITFEGDAGRFFVNRGTLEGTPVQQLVTRPLPDDAIAKLYGNGSPGSHMGNFFECMKSRTTPISDVNSHHRILTTCHLANLSLRLGRELRWDSESETVIGDDIANRLLSRDYRTGFEIT